MVSELLANTCCDTSAGKNILLCPAEISGQHAAQQSLCLAVHVSLPLSTSLSADALESQLPSRGQEEHVHEVPLVRVHLQFEDVFD
jgi:hypothetical protein